MKQRPGDQPLPRPNPDAPDMQTLVIADVEARRAIGIERYGQGLKPFDGRDNLRDLYEELIDAVIYCRKQIFERDGWPAATPRGRTDVLPDQARAALAALGAEMARQDNHCTAHPLYVVQEKQRLYGFDPNYADEPVWIDSAESAEADAATAKSLEAEYERTGRERDGWTRTAAVDRWDFVTACLTERAAKDYIARNGHRHKFGLRMFVDSAYRNTEIIQLQQTLKALATATVTP